MVTVKDAIKHGNIHVKNEPLTVEQVEKDLDQAIYKAVRNDQLPWIEAIIPYHISDEMINNIFDLYKDAGWSFIMARKFIETKTEQNSISPNYYIISYTKFVLTYDSENSKECLDFYKSEFNESEWKKPTKNNQSNDF